MRGRDFWLIVACIYLSPHLPWQVGVTTAVLALIEAYRCGNRGD